MQKLQTYKTNKSKHMSTVENSGVALRLELLKNYISYVSETPSLLDSILSVEVIRITKMYASGQPWILCKNCVRCMCETSLLLDIILCVEATETTKMWVACYLCVRL
jgi:hypothetical protein